MELNSIEEVVEDLKKGKCVVIMDDENRENEGDVICAAEFATTENVNFMASYAKALRFLPHELASQKLPVGGFSRFPNFSPNPLAS